MNICMVSDDFLPAKTGIGTHLLTIIPELVDRGHSIAVITSRRADAPDDTEWRGARIYRVTAIPAYGYYQALPSQGFITNVLRENEIEIVHSHYLGYMLTTTQKVVDRLRLKHIYTYHTPPNIITAPRLMRPFKQLVFNLHVTYCNRVSRILVPSSTYLEQIKRYGITTPCRYLSNPVLFSGDEATPKDPDRFVILFAGRISREKNIPFLLRAYKRLLKSTNGNVELRIAGEGYLLPEITKLCDREQIDSTVTFLGFLSKKQLAVEYANCSVFVLPSHVEVQALVAIEAMLFAKPVILADSIIAAQELVDEGGNGFIVRANDENELCSRLIQLKENAQLRASMGQKGKLKSRNYNVTAIVDSLEVHYAEVLGENRADLSCEC